MRSSSFIVWVILSLACVSYGCRDVMKCHDEILNTKLNTQINTEMKGHYTYLYLSQMFDQHNRHYPKVAKYLRAKAAEELSHAERFIQYQNQRGGTVEMDPVSLYGLGTCSSVEDVLTALKCAMELEAYVTSQLTQLHHDVTNISTNERSGCGTVTDDDLWLIQPLLVTCPFSGGGNDVTTAHWKNCDCESIKSVAYVELADMITHEFLDHQLEDTKEIASLYHTLFKLQSSGGAPGIGDFLFDKHLDL